MPVGSLARDRMMKIALYSVGVLLGLYLGSYSLLIKRELGSAMTTEGCVSFVYSTFRCGGRTAECFYAPALWIDGQMRSRYWRGLDGVSNASAEKADVAADSIP